MMQRRGFILLTLAAGPVFAQRGAQVDESDEQAVALNYRHDTSSVDGAKFPRHDPAQRCSNCSFWQGKPEDAWAGCAMFGRKHIANAGWCQAWSRQP